jgi:hypothetical protein
MDGIIKQNRKVKIKEYREKILSPAKIKGAQPGYNPV